MRICEQNRKNVTKRYEPLRTVANRNESYQDKDKDNNDKKDATSSDKQSKSSTVKKALIGGGIATISGILAFKNRGKIMSVTKNLLKKIKK